MVSKEQPTDLKGQTRAQLIMARRTDLRLKAEYICADLSSRPRFPLAVARRTIQYRYESVSMSALAIWHSLTALCDQLPDWRPTTQNQKIDPCGSSPERVGGLPEAQDNASAKAEIVLSVVGSVWELLQEVVGLNRARANGQPDLGCRSRSPPASMAKLLAAPVESDVTGK
jgi:hypothetical protein